MAESTREQAAVDKGNLAATHAEAKANFEENLGTVTFDRAEKQAKASWDDAHLSTAARQAKISTDRQNQLEEANARKAESKAERERILTERAAKKAVKEAAKK